MASSFVPEVPPLDAFLLMPRSFQLLHLHLHQAFEQDLLLLRSMACLVSMSSSTEVMAKRRPSLCSNWSRASLKELCRRFSSSKMLADTRFEVGVRLAASPDHLLPILIGHRRESCRTLLRLLQDSLPFQPVLSPRHPKPGFGRKGRGLHIFGIVI